MRLVVPLVAISTIFFFAYSTSYACSCLRPGAPAEELKRSEAVFSGKAIEVNSRDQDADPFTSVEAVFEVDKAWKGDVKKTVSVFTAGIPPPADSASRPVKGRQRAAGRCGAAASLPVRRFQTPR